MLNCFCPKTVVFCISDKNLQLRPPRGCGIAGILTFLFAEHKYMPCTADSSAKSLQVNAIFFAWNQNPCCSTPSKGQNTLETVFLVGFVVLLSRHPYLFQENEGHSTHYYALMSMIKYHINRVVRKPVFGVFEQVRCKSACSTTEGGSEAYKFGFREQRDNANSVAKTKALIRLRN